MSGVRQQLSTITRKSFGPHGVNKIHIKQQHKRLYLNELEIQHPPFKYLVLAGEEQHNKFGDGVNLVMLIAQKHLEAAKELVTIGIHTDTIIQAYMKATEKALKILESLVEEGSETMDVRNKDQVILRLKAPVASKQYEKEDILCPLIAEACIQVCPEDPVNFNVDNVRVANLLGKRFGDSKIFRGMVLNVNTVVGSIKRIEKAKVLVIAGGDDIAETNLIHSDEQLGNYAKTEEAKVEELIKESGAKVIVSGAAVGEMALDFCHRNKIMVLEIASQFELECFCRTTNAVALLNLGSTVNLDDLGYVDSISVEENRGARVTVTNEQGGVATVLLGARTMIIADELERAVVNGVNTYKALCRDSRIVPGAGATEIEIARQLKEFAFIETGSSDQNAIAKYAESFELIPKTLAENAFITADDTLTNLYEQHNLGNVNACINVTEGCCDDASALNIWDLYITKSEALKNAAEAVYKALSDQDDYLSRINRSKQKLKEMSVLLGSVMPSNKKWLDIEEFGEKIYGLTPHGSLHCFDKKTPMREFWCTEIGRGLQLLDRSSSDGSSTSNLYFNVVTCSDTVNKEDPLFLDEEVFGRVFRWNDTDYCQLSTVVKDMYIDPITGQHLSSADICPTNDVLRVNRSKIQLTVYNKEIERIQNHHNTKRKMDGFSFCIRYSTYFIVRLTLDGARWVETNNNQVIPNSIPYRFSPGVLYEDLQWVGKVLRNHGEVTIDVNQYRGTNLLCIARGGSDDDDVKRLVDAIGEVCRRKSSVLKVYGLGVLKDVYHFVIEKFGKPLRLFIEEDSSLIQADKDLIKLVEGVVNGIAALHDKEIAVGNLNINDFFVDKFLNVKISPFNTQRKFAVSSSLRGRRKRVTNSSVNIKFSLSQSAINDMSIVGQAIFCCFTGKEYRNEALNSLKNPPSYMRRLYEFPAAVDMLKQIFVNKLTAIQAWNHTLFWPWSKNLTFIRAIQERLELRGNLLTVVNNLNAGGSVFAQSWKSKFPGEFITVMNYTSYRQDKTYVYTSLFDLLCIGRHLITHQESVRQNLDSLITTMKGENQLIDPRIYKMFGDPVAGQGVMGSDKRFESYFQEQFPNLVPTLYNGMRPFFEVDEDFFDYYNRQPS